MDVDVLRAVRLWYSPAAAELAIDLKPEENESRLGVGISCTEEVYSITMHKDTANDLCLFVVWLQRIVAGGCPLNKRIAGVAIPWMNFMTVQCEILAMVDFVFVCRDFVMSLLWIQAQWLNGQGSRLCTKLRVRQENCLLFLVWD